MRDYWNMFLFGLTGGVSLTFAIVRRNEGVTDWLGPGLTAAAMFILAVGVARRAKAKLKS